MSNYYPDGTGPNDPDAPWNARDREEFKVVHTDDICSQCGESPQDTDDGHMCSNCFCKNQEVEEDSQWTD